MCDVELRKLPSSCTNGIVSESHHLAIALVKSDAGEAEELYSVASALPFSRLIRIYEFLTGSHGGAGARMINSESIMHEADPLTMMD